MGLGQAIQTLLGKNRLGVILNMPPMWGWVWVERPEFVGARWVRGHLKYVPTMRMALGRATQTLLGQDRFEVILSMSPLWGWVWLKQPKLCGRWVQDHPKYVPTVSMGLGRVAQILLGQDGFRVILSTSPLWGWFWVEWPKICSRCVQGHPDPAHTMEMGFDRATQTLWHDGFKVIVNMSPLWVWVWVKRPKPCGMGLGSSRSRPHYGDGFGSSNPNFSQNPPYNATKFHIYLNIIQSDKLKMDDVISCLWTKAYTSLVVQLWQRELASISGWEDKKKLLIFGGFGLSYCMRPFPGLLLWMPLLPGSLFDVTSHLLTEFPALC